MISMGVYNPVDVYPSYFDEWDYTLEVNKSQDLFIDIENNQFIIQLWVCPRTLEEIIISNQGEIIYER